MGANAQTAVPVFTAGQVLTAQQQTEINTGIPVFATTVTRDAAFGGTGEKTLAEGQFAYIEATNTTQYYDGAAWQAVGVTPALVPIVPTSITVGGGTATASANGQVTMTSVTTSILLNGVFSSTYTNYRFVWNGVGASDYNLTGRLSVGGSASSASDYFSNQIYAVAGAPYAQNLAAATSFDYRAGATRQMSFTADVVKPFVADPTTILGIALQNATAGTAGIPYLEGHYNKAATSYDGIQFLTDAAVTGTLSVYGYTK